MSNSIAPGSSADVNVKVTALTTNPNVPAQYKTIILKKNLVNGVNTLTQDMVSATNTKYVIKHDYVLGENITIPASCMLEFDGGSISGSYTLTGSNTGINAGLVKIFNTNVTIAGSWNIVEAYPEWFGAKGDGVNDDYISVEAILQLRLPTHFTRRYYLSDSIHIHNNIYGKAELIFNSQTYGIYISDVSGIIVSDLIFDANNTPTTIIRIENVQNCIINSCIFKKIVGNGDSSLGAIQVNSVFGLEIYNSTFSNISNVGTSASSGITINNVSKNIKIHDCTFDTITSLNDADCIKILGETTNEVCAIIENCVFSNFGKRAIKIQAYNVTTQNNTIYVNNSCYTCIDFQRGKCKSINDVIHLNFDEGIITGVVQLCGSDNTLEGLRVYCQQASISASNGIIRISETGDGSNTFVKNTVINNVIATGLRFFIVTSSGVTSIENLSVTKCIHRHFTGDSSYYCINIKGTTNTTIKNSILEMDFPANSLSNNDTSFEDCLIKSYGINTNHINTSYLREKNTIIFDTNYNISIIKSAVIKQNKGTFYAKQDFNPNNVEYSYAEMLKGSKVGDIVYVPAVNTDNNIKVGYICTVDGTTSQTGTFKDYII